MLKSRILIADDSAFTRNLLKDIFADKYEVCEASDREETIELIKQYGNELDLILLDIMMPNVSGFEVLDYCKKKGIVKQIPIIMVTASSELDDELKAYNNGAAEIIHKPFVPNIVLKRVENLIELYENRNYLSKQLKDRTEELIGNQKYDRLTGLLNMKQFLSSANELLDGLSDEEQAEYSFIYGNIRNFKYFNAKYDMEHGDRVLVRLSEIIGEELGDGLTSRFGQDHFVSLSKDPDLLNIIERTYETFNEECDPLGMHLKVGVYHMNGERVDAYTACECAKLACDSIRTMTDYVCEYDSELEKKIETRTFVIHNIDEAIKNQCIQVYYQPIVRTISGNTCSVEALARWIDPVEGFLSPADFIQPLEENRLIYKLDMCVLRRICQDILDVQSQGKVVLPVSINISRVDFECCNVFDEVNTIVDEYGVSHEHIIIEITESTMMRDPEMIKAEMKRFKDAGYKVWMDDFGSGFSSLNIFNDFQFDNIKLDMKFMRSFDERSKAIISSIITMAKKLGVQTLAEGVETNEQYDFLKKIGCEKVQGYYFSKPIPIEDLIRKENSDSYRMESAEWREYYDMLGATNFITERPTAIIEYEDKKFRFLYANEKFNDVLESIEANTMDLVYNNINMPTSPLYKAFRDVSDTLHVGGGIRHIFYEVRGYYVRLNAKCIAEHGNKSVFEVEIFNITNLEDKSSTFNLDKATRTTFSLFDMIGIANTKTGEFEILRYGAYKSMDDPEQLHAASCVEDALTLASNLIHPSERSLYMEFVRPSTVDERIIRSKRNYITKYFRTQDKSGAYVWKAHTIMHTIDDDTVMYCSRYTPLDDNELLTRLGLLLNSDTQGITDEHTLLIFNECMRRALEESDINGGIQELIDYLGHILGGERAYIFEVNEDNCWDNTYEWCAFNVEPQIENLKQIPYEETEVWNNKLDNGQFVIIPNVEAIKESDPTVYNYLYPQDIQSLVVGPIFRDGKLHGFYGVDNPPGDKLREIASVMGTLSSVIESMLDKRDLLFKLETLSYVDNLLALGNRHAVESYLAKIKKEKNIGLAFCDVCGLKIVNDTLGHMAGDQLLIQASEMIKKYFSEYRIFRWGGDEILVLAVGIDKADIEDRCEKLRHMSDEYCAPLAVGCVWRETGDFNIEDILDEADQLMYADKRDVHNADESLKDILMRNKRLLEFH